MLSTFMTAAVAGTTSERKTTVSSSSERPTTTTMKSGSFDASTFERSAVVAVAPPIDGLHAGRVFDRRHDVVAQVAAAGRSSPRPAAWSSGRP